MAYFAPYIDEDGIHIPSFVDINAYLQTNYANIYGQTISGNVSTSDIQANTNDALMINDCMNLLQAVFNGMSPVGAIGTQQDTLYKLNGIDRNEPTYSTAVCNLTGKPSSTITNCVAVDQLGNLWNLPASVTFDGSGNATGVTVKAQVLGNITASASTITGFQTPTANWLSITNPAAAIPGVPVEADSDYRARQAISQELPSQSLVTGTLAEIGATDGVTRYSVGIPTPGGAPGTSIENPSGSTDSWGNPAHSISMVVEGATNLEVATAIYINKTPGALTNGSTTVPVIDPVTGISNNISFFRPTYVPIFVSLTIEPLAGYTSASTAAIQAALVAYLNELQIGENVTISALYAAAMATMPSIITPLFSITALTAGIAASPVVTVDIDIAYTSVASTVSGNIVVTT
jgi:uncharacterized phage protein gp47/JayE